MKDRLRQLVVFLIVGGFAGLAVYSLAAMGKLPTNLTPSSGPVLQNNQTRTVVQEENAVISVVEKTSPSVVAIGVSQRVVNPFNPFLCHLRVNPKTIR